MTNQRKVWFITGVSRGLGQALVNAVLATGDIAIGTTRDGTAEQDAHERLHILPLELTDPAGVRQTVAAAFRLAGRVDVLVNNAGYGLLGAVEEASDAKMHHVFDANFFGPLRVMQAALPLLRAQGFEPGAFRTDFLLTHSVRRSARRIAAYDGTASANVAHLDRIAGTQSGDPDRGAAAIVRLAQAPEPPLHLVLGTDALRRTKERQAELAAELAAWQDVSAGTDFHEVA